MSRPSPFIMTIGEDGLSVRCELDVHYLTDEQMEAILEYVETLERMNVLLREENGRLQIESGKLRELVRDMHRAICGLVVLGDDYAGEYEDRLYALDDRMRELGVDA